METLPFSIDEIFDAVETDEHVGFCRSCGATKDSVEPDARNYHCDECGDDEVFGAEELLIMYA